MSIINYEELSFKIISLAGEAKTNVFKALKNARENDFEEYEKNILSAKNGLIEAEKQHMNAICEEASGIKQNISILFIHAEDQLLTTQLLIELASEFWEIYKKINFQNNMLSKD